MKSYKKTQSGQMIRMHNLNWMFLKKQIKIKNIKNAWKFKCTDVSDNCKIGHHLFIIYYFTINIYKYCIICDIIKIDIKII